MAGTEPGTSFNPLTLMLAFKMDRYRFYFRDWGKQGKQTQKRHTLLSNRDGLFVSSFLCIPGWP